MADRLGPPTVSARGNRHSDHCDVGWQSGSVRPNGRRAPHAPAGSYDLLVEVVCEDNEALLHFLAHKLRRVAGVRETETFVYLRMLKQVYTWGTR
jgi:Lrp/AsnC ligand binding domain